MRPAFLAIAMVAACSEQRVAENAPAPQPSQPPRNLFTEEEQNRMADDLRRVVNAQRAMRGETQPLINSLPPQSSAPQRNDPTADQRLIEHFRDQERERRIDELERRADEADRRARETERLGNR